MIEESKSKKSLKNIAISFSMLLLNFIVVFVYRKLFVVVFDVNYLGVVSIFSNIFNLLSLAELGFGSAVMYALYRPLAEGDNIAVAQIIKFFRKVYWGIAIVVGVVGLAIMPLLPYIIKDMPSTLEPNAYIIYAFYLAGSVLSYFSSYKATLLLADQREYQYKLISTSVTVGARFLIILLLLFIKHFYVVLVVENIINIASNVILTLVVNKKYKFLKGSVDKISASLKKSIMRYTCSMFTAKLGAVVLNVTDMLLISIFFGASASGVYSNYLLLTTSIGQIIAIIYSGIQASVGQYNARYGNEKSYDLFHVVNFIGVWLSVVATGGMLFVSNNLVAVWLGADYIIGNQLLFTMLCLSFFVENLARAYGLFIVTSGVFNKTAYLSIVYAVVNLGVSILLIFLMGISGVFLGTIVARIIVMPIEIWYLHRYAFKQSVWKYYLKTALILAVGAISYAIMYALTLVVIENAILSLLYRFAVALIVPNALFVICFFRTHEFKQILELFHIDKLLLKLNARNKDKNIKED